MVMWMTEYLRSLFQHFTTPSDIPHTFNYTHMFEYLMKREVIVLSADEVVIDNVMLPVAENHCGVSVCGRVLRRMQPCRSDNDR